MNRARALVAVLVVVLAEVMGAMDAKGAISGLISRDGPSVTDIWLRTLNGGAETGRLGRHLERLPKHYVPLSAEPTVEFVLTGGGIGSGHSALFSET